MNTLVFVKITLNTHIRLDGILKMIKNMTALTLLLALTGCANQSISKDMVNKDIVDQAKPLYEICLKDYKKTMSEDDAKKACTEKLKDGYKKVTAE